MSIGTGKFVYGAKKEKNRDGTHKKKEKKKNSETYHIHNLKNYEWNYPASSRWFVFLTDRIVLRLIWLINNISKLQNRTERFRISKVQNFDKQIGHRFTQYGAVTDVCE